MSHSYSSLSDAHECLRKYYLKYIVKSVPKEPSLDTEFGQALHLAIKAHYEGQDALGVFHLYWNMCKKDQLKKFSFTWEELSALGDKFVTRFITRYADQFEPLALEKKVTVSVGGLEYTGVIDMICKYKGLVTVLDFKTSTRPFSTTKLYTDEQLYGYVPLAASLGFKVEQVMYFVFVKKTGAIQTNLRAKLVEPIQDGFWNNIQCMMRDLSTRKEFPRNPNCKYCVCGQYRGPRR